MIENLLKLNNEIKLKNPLIHCITNPISINGCANIILAAGARPVMAEHPAEAAAITASASSLMLNLGNITDARMESMPLSLETAREREIPVLLDLVGVSSSPLRMNFAERLLKDGGISILKGNMSELLAMAGCPSHSSGVDAGAEDALTKERLPEICRIFGQMARDRKAVVLATGKEDFVTDGHRFYLVKNGTEMLSHITGTGCMAGALTAAFLAGKKPLEAALLGMVRMGTAGEIAAETSAGPGTFSAQFMDTLYGISDEKLRRRSQIEEI